MARLLVIDDDVDLATLTTIRLKKAGHDVTAAHDGEAGLAAIRAGHPELVVLDWMMPGMDGIEVAIAVRADASIASTPLVMITAKSGAGDFDKALAAGIDSVLSKPYVPKELLARIDSILSAA
jgi:two-component system phosphate regulon response regulator PhoB